MRPLLLAFTLSGTACSSPPATMPAAPTEPPKLTGADRAEVEKILRDLDRVVEAGDVDQAVQTWLPFLPTDDEVAAAFPNHHVKALPFFAGTRAALPRSLKGTIEIFGRSSDLADLRIDDARETWPRSEEPRKLLLPILASDILVTDGEATRKIGGPRHPLLNLMYVKGRWVLLTEPDALAKELGLVR